MTTATAVKTRHAPATAGEIIRANIGPRMKTAGLGITALAKAAGLAHGGLSDFMNEKKEALTLESLAAIAAALQCSVGDLLGEARAGGVALTLPHGAIRPNPDQPRHIFDTPTMAQLKASIKSYGLLKPLLIQPDGGLQDGERRWRVIGELIAEGSWPADQEIPVAIGPARPVDDRMAAGLVANMQREDLSPLEEARCMQKLIDNHKWTRQRIAEAVGCSKRHVQYRLALVRDLDPEVQKALHTQTIPLAVARAMTAAPKAMQKTALERITDGTYGWDSVEGVRRNLFREMVPVGRNIFALEEYKGVIVDDPDDDSKKYFQDRALFIECQRAAAAAEKVKLEAEGYEWARVYDRTTDDNFALYSYDTDARKKAGAGAVVEIKNDLTVHIHKGLYKPGKQPLPGIPAADKVVGAVAAAKAAGPIKITRAHMIACRRAKTETLQLALAASPAMALRAACLGLLAGNSDIMLRVSQSRSTHDFPEGDALATLESRWGECFKKLQEPNAFNADKRSSIAIAKWDDAKHAKAWEILCHMKEKELGELHAVLMAGLVGSWSGQAPALGDAPLPLAMAKSLGLESAGGFELTEEFLKTCGKQQLLEIARATAGAAPATKKKPVDYDLSKLKMKELLALLLDEIKAGGLKNYIPPVAKFGTPAAIEKALPLKGG